MIILCMNMENKMTNLPQGWKMETLGEILSSDKYSIKRGAYNC